jgi:hypothetical protein
MKSVLFAMAILFNLPAMAQSAELLFKNGAVQATATFAEAPHSSALATMYVEFKDAGTQAPLEVAEQLQVVLWMPDMGHGSRPVKIEHAVDAQGNALAGVYKVTKMSFMMEGTWEIRVILKAADGSLETQTFNVDVE